MLERMEYDGMGLERMSRRLVVSRLAAVSVECLS